MPRSPMRMTYSLSGLALALCAGSELPQLIGKHHPGESVTLDVWRNGKKKSVKVTLMTGGQ